MNQQSSQITRSNPGLRVGIVQLCSGRRVDDNLLAADKLIRSAASEGARYILTPENTALMELEPELVKLAAQRFEENSVLAHFRALARELSIWLHIGSLAVRPDQSDQLVNRSVLISPKGAIAAHYDKIHLFDVDLPNGESYRETDSYQPGNRAVLAELSFEEQIAKLGFSICYDIRFPGLYRTLAKAGAQLITVPAAFTKQTGQAHWHVLLRARAIETGCFIMAAAQGGRHENGRSTYGHSLIISPWGEVIAEAGIEPQILVADLDLSKVTDTRQKIPALSHDRPFAIGEAPSPTILEEVS